MFETPTKGSNLGYFCWCYAIAVLGEQHRFLLSQGSWSLYRVLDNPIAQFQCTQYLVYVT